MDFKVINFSEAVAQRQKSEEAAAYEWVVKEQRYNGLISQPVRMEANDDLPLFEAEGFFAAMFRRGSDEDVILWRQWDDGFVVQYNVVTNFDELLDMAPQTVAKLLKNGIELSHRYKKVFHY